MPILLKVKSIFVDASEAGRWSCRATISAPVRSIAIEPFWSVPLSRCSMNQLQDRRGDEGRPQPQNGVARHVCSCRCPASRSRRMPPSQVRNRRASCAWTSAPLTFEMIDGQKFLCRRHFGSKCDAIEHDRLVAWIFAASRRRRDRWRRRSIQWDPDRLCRRRDRPGKGDLGVTGSVVGRIEPEGMRGSIPVESRRRFRRVDTRGLVIGIVEVEEAGAELESAAAHREAAARDRGRTATGCVIGMSKSIGRSRIPVAKRDLVERTDRRHWT